MKRFARYFEIFRNGGDHARALELLLAAGSPFDRFLAFSDWLYARLGRTNQIALARRCELIFEFLHGGEEPAPGWSPRRSSRISTGERHARSGSRSSRSTSTARRSSPPEEEQGPRARGDAVSPQRPRLSVEAGTTNRGRVERDDESARRRKAPFAGTQCAGHPRSRGRSRRGRRTARGNDADRPVRTQLLDPWTLSPYRVLNLGRWVNQQTA